MKIFYFIAYHHHRLFRFFYRRKGKYQTADFEYHHKKMKHFKGLLLVVLLLFILAKPAVADFLTEQDQTLALGESLPHSIVLVSDTLGHGSGFYISPHEIITDEHVVHNLNSATVSEINGKQCSATVYYADSNADLALLDTKCSGEPLKLADSVNVGQTALMMGNPEDQRFFLSKGIVSNLSQYFMGFDAAAFPGDSGSPIVNLNGEVMGVARFVYNASSNVAVATNDKTLSEFIAYVGYLKSRGK